MCKGGGGEGRGGEGRGGRATKHNVNKSLLKTVIVRMHVTNTTFFHSHVLHTLTTTHSKTLKQCSGCLLQGLEKKTFESLLEFEI